MRFSIQTGLLAFFAAFAMATGNQKSVIVSYDRDTPNSVIDSAMAAIRDAVRYHDNPLSRKAITDSA